MNTKIDIRIIREADPDAVVRLYRDAGWWDDSYTTDFIPHVIKNSFCVAGAFYGKRLIGMGRAISDGISDAYIQDIAVLNNYRGQGIGTRIVQTIIDYLRKHDIDWIGLIGVPDTKEFYERLGFEIMPGHLPMLLKPPPRRRPGEKDKEKS